MTIENRKITLIKQPWLNGNSNAFSYERYDGSMTVVKKYNWDTYSELSLNGSKLLFQYDGYAFFDSKNLHDIPHYWIGVSYTDMERPDTFFELELKTFYDLIAMRLNENDLPQFHEELHLIEFAGQLLERIDLNAG